MWFDVTEWVTQGTLARDSGVDISSIITVESRRPSNLLTDPDTSEIIEITISLCPHFALILAHQQIGR